MDKIDQLKIHLYNFEIGTFYNCVRVPQLDQRKRLSFQLQTSSGLIFFSLFSWTFTLTLMRSGPFYRYLPLSKLFEMASQEIRKYTYVPVQLILVL